MAERLRPAKCRAQFVPDCNSSDSDDFEVRIMRVTSREVANVVVLYEIFKGELNEELFLFNARKNEIIMIGILYTSLLCVHRAQK